MGRKLGFGVWQRGSCWTREEDQILLSCVEIHGARKWARIAREAGLKRSGKSCRLRWLNYLRPDIKRGNITEEEEDLIIRLHKLLGNRWSLIAGRLPGRTDNEIKNYWNKVMKKRANHASAEVQVREEDGNWPPPASDQNPNFLVDEEEDMVQGWEMRELMSLNSLVDGEEDFFVF